LDSTLNFRSQTIISCRQTCITSHRHAAQLGHTLIKLFATYPRQERKSTLPVVSIAVGMRSKNKNTVMLKYCGIENHSAYLGHERILEIIVPRHSRYIKFMIN